MRLRLLAALLLLLCALAQPQARQQQQLQQVSMDTFNVMPVPTPNPPALGVNLPDIVWRSLDARGKAVPSGVASALDTISSACTPRPVPGSGGALAFSLARFPILPMYPAGLGAVLANSTEYWPVLDALLQGLTAAGCSYLVPTLFYNPYALPDWAGEPMSLFVQAARNSTPGGGVSFAWDASLAFIDQLVARYANWTSIRAWELSHEWNLQYDMDASAGCYACNESLGTPAGGRTRAGHNVSTADGGAVQQRWAARIRARDTQLLRPISSGHALPRPAALHLSRSYARGGGAAGLDWTPDSLQDFTAILNATHVGMDWVSVHLRPGASAVRWTGAQRVSEPGSAALPLLVGLTAAMDNITQVTRGGLSRQRLFIGDFGASTNASGSSGVNASMARSVEGGFSSGSAFVDDLLQGLVATALNAPTPPPGAVTGLIQAAAVADFGFTDAQPASATGLGGVYDTAQWPGQEDGVYAALSAAKLGNGSGSESLWPNSPSDPMLYALLTYAALHTEPPFVIPGACDVSLFLPPFTYRHTDNMQLARQCFSSIQQLAMGEFVPPSQYAVLTVMCKGACRQYAAVWFRLQEAWRAAGCVCSPPAWSVYGAPAATADPALFALTNGGFLCPHSANAELCRRTGLCYEDYTFYNWTCSAGACGRFAGSSLEYAAARKKCSLPTDGAGAAGVAGVALAAAVAAVAAGALG